MKSDLTAMVKTLVADRVDAAMKADFPAALKQAARDVAERMVKVLPMAEVGKLLGYRQPRTTIAACKRLGIPLVRISERRRVVKVADLVQWMDARKEVAK